MGESDRVDELIGEVRILSEIIRGLTTEIRTAYRIPISLVILGMAFYGYFLKGSMADWVFLVLIGGAIQPMGFNFGSIAKALKKNISH